MPEAKRTRFEPDRPSVASSFRGSRTNAELPNEPTAKSINRGGQRSYEK